MKMEAIKYPLMIVIATLIGIYLLPWWVSPILIFVIAYFFMDDSLKAFGIATLITGTIWMLITIVKDNLAAGKVSEVTGQILLGMSPTTLYIITGLVISLVSGMMASAGVQLKSALKTSN
jgi:hypothetical protein